MPLQSPCIQRCQIDRISGLCLGCKRTLPEIENWTRLSGAQQKKIISTLSGRSFATAQCVDDLSD